MKTVRTLGAILCASLTAVFALCGILLLFPVHGFAIFQYYTVDSNTIAALAGILLTFFLLRALVTKKPVPVWILLAYFTAAVCLTLTFLVVVLVLAPAAGENGYRMMLTESDMLYHHLLNPILTVFSTLLLLPRIPTKIPEIAHIALLPTELYGLCAVLCNYLLWWHGPYPFLCIYDQPLWDSVLWCVGILGGTYVIGFFMAMAKKAVDRRLR